MVRREEYPALQQRAELTPWREMKATALQEASLFADDSDLEIRERCNHLARAFSLNALGYILDPNRSIQYLDRITTLMTAFDGAVPGSVTDLMRHNQDKTLWIYAVPTGNAYVQAVLALDIIHDDLAVEDLLRIESILRDGPADYFQRTTLAWYQGSWAARAIWPLYQRDAPTYEPIIRMWHQDVLDSISTDGVFSGGNGYATARWTNPDREHKYIFGDILAHTGVAPSWYQQPRLQNFQEWLTGYSHTPSRVAWTFGDTSAGVFSPAEHTGTERAYRYSPLAGAYAGWLNRNAIPQVFLSTYVLTGQHPLPPAVAPSRIFPDGGAYLKESSLDPQALAGVLHNLRNVHDAHAHKDTNSLGIAGYGELLLRAAGYNGWATDQDGFSWDYIHHRAIGANVALFDYPLPADHTAERNPSPVNDHISTSGDGITAALLGGKVEWACGDSGSAIGNGHQLRNFLFVHPADGVAGYFVTIDQLTSVQPGATGQLVWHPAASEPDTSSDGSEFSWHIRRHTESGVTLTLFLATTPDVTSLHDGVLADWEVGLVARYLVAGYRADADGNRNVITVQFPHAAGHSRPDFRRGNTWPGGSSAAIQQSDVVDHLYTSADPGDYQPEPTVRTQAAAGWHRRDADGAIRGLWLKDATMFFDGDNGFRCSSPTTVWSEGNRLRLLCREDTDISIRRRDLLSARVGPDTAEQIPADDNSCRVTVPAGYHELTLELASTPH